MVKYLLTPIFLFTSLILTAQITPTTQWAWLKGNNALDQVGVYGTQGTFSSSNRPGSRDGMVSWKDAGGNFWIFGGNGYSAGPRGYLNDLWKYDVNLNQWQWVSGANTIDDPGDISVFGSPDAAVYPGARRYATAWTDQLGRLWLFGGEGFTPNGFGMLNDLWMFDPISNLWTWVGGNENPGQFTEFGVQGLPDPSNMPGSRYGAGSWVDTAGDLWLFGGLSYDDPTPSYSNELWHYNIVSGEWTWITGTFVLNTGGTYGSQGIPSTGNSPGARMDMATWTSNSGRLYLFGGYGLDDNSGEGAMNDMWEYNISTGEWTWRKGDNIVNQVGVYGSQGAPASGNTPGARFQASTWKDAFGTLWMFGGDGYGNAAQGLLSDLWKYDEVTHRWTWIKGDGVPDRSSVYGTQGVASPTARPGGRRSSVTMADAAGNIWLFGGNGFDATTNTDLLNDLWKLGSFAPVPVSALVLDARLENNTVRLRWHTLNEKNTSNYILQKSHDGINFFNISYGETIGNFDGRTEYSGADAQPRTGMNYYRVAVYDIDGNVTLSNVAAIDFSDVKFILYPNPATSFVIIDRGSTGGSYRISLFDLAGRKVMDTNGTGIGYIRLNLSAINSGTYLFRYTADGKVIDKLLVVN